LVETILKSVAVAVVLSAIGAVWKWGRGPLANLLQRWRLDHQSLNTGPWQVYLPPSGTPSGVQVRVLCAPSRRQRRSRFDIGKAISFVERDLKFAGKVAYTGIDDGVRCEVESSPSTPDYAWACRNGMIDVCLTIPVTGESAGRRVLDVRPVLEVVATVHDAIRSSAYCEMLGLPRSRRRQRLDWLIGVSVESRQTDMQILDSWSDVKLADGALPRAVADQRPFCPANGYGTDQLRGGLRPRSLEYILRTFLAAFLTANGYHDFEENVGQTVDEFLIARGDVLPLHGLEVATNNRE
jgi:hypothetical protein